jgi:tetratricopeptide (TPR) repeat protein
VDAAAIEHGGDAEVLAIAGNLTLPFDPARARRLCGRAVEIDPEFADAHQVVASAAAELGEREVARAAFDRCIDLSANAGDSLWERGMLRARDGDAKGAEADARRSVSIARGVHQLELFLGAVYARGARASALRSVADSLVAQWPSATRAVFEARLLASLALLHGDVAQCEAELRRGLDACSAQRSESTHALVYGLALQLAMEQGDVTRAGDLAIAYIDARELLTRAGRPWLTSYPSALAAAVRAGRMDAETALRERVSWFEEYGALGPGLCWGLAFADADDDASRDAARRLRPPPATFWLHRQPMFSDDVGRAALLVGDDDLACEHLAAAARTCLAPSEPVRSTRANLSWAKLLEARGRREEAQTAYRVVTARWGRTSLAAAIEAKERLGVLDECRNS